MSILNNKNESENNNSKEASAETDIYTALDFSNLLTEKQLEAFPHNIVMNTITDLLEKISCMNIYAKTCFDLDYASDLNYNEKDGLIFVKLRDRLGALLNYFNIKYIPGYEMRFRGQPYMLDLLLVDISKNNKKIITLDVNFDFLGHYQRVFLEKRD